MAGSKVTVQCPVCGRSLNKNGLPGHMRFKHNTDQRGQRKLESTPGILSEDTLTCLSCGSTDMNAVGLQGETVRMQGEVQGDSFVRDTKPASIPIVAKMRYVIGPGAKNAQYVLEQGKLAERAPAGKKFLELKCRKCGARKIISISVT